MITALFKTKLWPDGIPVWAGRMWADLKDVLPENEGWNVWTEWYEARLVGGSANEDLEFLRAGIQHDERKNGASHINGKIRQYTRSEEMESLEESLSFLEDIRRKIASDATPDFGHPLEMERRAEMKYRIEKIRASLSDAAPERGKIGHNEPPMQIEEGMREVADDLDREVEKSDPNVNAVVEATIEIGEILIRKGTKLVENGCSSIFVKLPEAPQMLNMPRFSQHSAARPGASLFALELTDRAKIRARNGVSSRNRRSGSAAALVSIMI